MIPCGTYPNLPFSEYRELDLLNFSSLKQIGTSPKHYQRYVQAGRDDTPALRLGRGFHMATLEPDAFFALPQFAGSSRRGKAWDAFEAANQGAELLLRNVEHEQCQAMAEAVHRHPIATELLSVGAPEFTIVWELEGEQCKSRIDWLGKHAIVDCKSAREIEPRAFARDAARYGYHRQAAFYQDAVEHATGNRLPFYLVVAESTPPHDVVVYQVPDEAIAQGRKDVAGWMRTYKRCVRENKWPGVSTEVLTLELPTWAFMGEDVL